MQLGRDALLFRAENIESSDAKTLAEQDFKNAVKTGLITDGVLVASVQAVHVVDRIAGVVGLGAAGIILNNLNAASEGNLSDERKRGSYQQDVRLWPSSPERSSRESYCPHFIWGKACAAIANSISQIGFRTEETWPVCVLQILCMRIKVYMANQVPC